MKNIDYKSFVPRGENNFVRFYNNKEIEIDDIISINIFLADDKVVYWFYVKILEDDAEHRLILKKGKKPTLTLLIGNNPYEIIGEAEVINTSFHNWEEKFEISLCFTVINASNIINNPRKIVEYDRSEILDIRDD